MDSGVETELRGEPVAEATVGSVTIPIYYAPVTVKVVVPVLDGSGKPQETTKTYDSYFVNFYEGSVRVQKTRKSPGSANWLDQCDGPPR